MIPKWLKPNEFDYGYAITCHKSQGSEYDKVIVLEEYLKGDSKEEHARWLYTAATRAAKKLIVVRNYRQ
jgi:ATP-dependent exoDNAse (exonuclease V) alpha subunit